MKIFKKITQFIAISVILAVSFSYVSLSDIARTTTKCNDRNFNAGLCSGTITTCVSKTPQENGKDHISVWVHVVADCGILGSFNEEGNIFDGELSLKLPDGSPIPYNGALLFDESDIITSATYDPPIDSAANLAEWSPVGYNIEFRDSISQELTGILVKTEADSIPVYYTYKTYSSNKISDTTLAVLIQALNYGDPNFEAMNVFPNPANEQITISFNFYPEVDGYPSIVGKTLDYLKIYNLEGKEVYKEMNIPSRENKIIDIKSLPSGTYIIETAVNSANLKWQTMFSIGR